MSKLKTSDFLLKSKNPLSLENNRLKKGGGGGHNIKIPKPTNTEYRHVHKRTRVGSKDICARLHEKKKKKI